MDAKHSDLPWKVEESNGNLFVQGARAEFIADCDNTFPSDLPTCRANAGFIVRACNAHDDLLQLVEEFIDNTDVPDRNCSCHISPPCSDCVEHSYTRELIKRGRALILKAKEGAA